PTKSEASAVPIGFDDDSAYLGGFARRAIGSILAVPSAVRHIQDIASFRYVTLLFLARARDLRLISVWHPSFMSLLLADLVPMWERLLRDIAEGGCRAPNPLPASIAASLGPGLAPDPRRAAELAHVSPSRPSSIWPRLGLISCWADGHARLHLPSLQRQLP